jgi:hypothetical protein
MHRGPRRDTLRAGWRSVALRGGAVVVLLAGCALPPLGKNRCSQDSDCLPPHECRAGICVNPDASSSLPTTGPRYWQSLLWQNPQFPGAVSLWDMAGTQYTGTARGILGGKAATIAGAGDFNGDGLDDIVWRNDGAADNSQSNSFWDLRDPLVPLETALPVDESMGPGWRIEAICDLNGDQHTDLVFRDSVTGAGKLWLMQRAEKSGEVAFSRHPPSWEIEGCGDLHGDGVPALIWRDLASARVSAWRLHAVADGQEIVWNELELPGAPAADTRDLDGRFLQRWRIQAVADVDLDGRDDLFWRNALESDKGFPVAQFWLMDGASVNDRVTMAPAVLEATPSGMPHPWQVRGMLRHRRADRVCAAGLDGVARCFCRGIGAGQYQRVYVKANLSRGCHELVATPAQGETEGHCIAIDSLHALPGCGNAVVPGAPEGDGARYKLLSWHGQQSGVWDGGVCGAGLGTVSWQEWRVHVVDLGLWTTRPDITIGRSNGSCVAEQSGPWSCFAGSAIAPGFTGISAGNEVETFVPCDAQDITRCPQERRSLQSDGRFLHEQSVPICEGWDRPGTDEDSWHTCESELAALQLSLVQEQLGCARGPTHLPYVRPSQE